MATAATLARMQQKAIQAEHIIACLKSKLDALRKEAVSSACKVEEARIKKENDVLRADIGALQGRLIQAETKNGVTQVPVPSAANLLPRPTLTQPGAQAAASFATAAAKPPAKKKEKKEKNKDNAGTGNPEDKGAADQLPIDVSRLNMRIGQIVAAKKHPDADSLYVEEVNVGEERNRTIVSGLVKHVPLEQMQDRLAIFAVNLKPAKMRGILSEGMIMCGSSPEKVEIIDPPAGCVPGQRIVFDGYPGTPDVLLNPKKKIWEQIQPNLRIDDRGVATYKGVRFQVEGLEGDCRVPSMTNSAIK